MTKEEDKKTKTNYMTARAWTRIPKSIFNYTPSDHCALPCRRKFGGDWSETRDFSCSITVLQSDKTVWSENNYTDLTKKLKKNLKRKMMIISRSAAPFSSIISVFLLTVICQNEASKLKRLDQAVSKAHFEFSLDLYKTLGKN